MASITPSGQVKLFAWASQVSECGEHYLPSIAQPAAMETAQEYGRFNVPSLPCMTTKDNIEIARLIAGPIARTNQENTVDAKKSLCAELAKKSGVSAQDVEKVLNALGVDNHIEDAAKALGAAPTLNDVLLGFHLSKNSVMV